MPAPLAKGLIIAASVLVAAGIAIYESPQVREWVDQSRRKIALALHSLGDEFNPPHRRPSESEDAFDARQESIRRKRNELVRRAREEGVAVDLDELVRIGREEAERAESGRHSGGRADRARSFDEIVGADGALRGEATGVHVQDDEGVRKRGAAAAAATTAGAGFAAGAAVGAAVANPFADDAVLFDVGDDDDTFVSTSTPADAAAEQHTHDSSATLAAAPLVDLTPSTDLAASASADLDMPAQSFYSLASSFPAAASSSDALIDPDFHSTGTLTPRSTTSHSTLAFSLASDINDQVGSDDGSDDVFSTLAHDNDTTDAFSDGGFTDAFSEGGFSDVGRGTGALTPSSWTDVGSDEGSEWGGNGDAGNANGGVSQVQM
jgi:hypothetical protein